MCRVVVCMNVLEMSWFSPPCTHCICLTLTDYCMHEHSPLRVLLGPYSLQLNFKHSSQYISHRCHRVHGEYIPVCIRGVELRARYDRQRLTVEKDVFMFTVSQTYTHTRTALQNWVLISPQEIYERTRHLYIIYKAPASYILTSLKTCSAVLGATEQHCHPSMWFCWVELCEAYMTYFNLR